MKKVVTGILSVLLVIDIVLFGTCIYFLIRSMSFVGVYKFESMSMEMAGGNIKVEVGKEVELFGMPVTYDEDYMVLTVNNDNSWELTTTSGTLSENKTETQTGTWKKEDGKYYLVLEEEEIEVTVKNWKVSFKMESATVVLTK